MSVVASVMCRCLAEGTATPPAAFAALIAIDEAGFPTLTCPHVANEAVHEAFESWRMKACEHLDMTYVEAKVSGYNRARLKGEAAELAELPALQALTEDNEGITSPVEAARLLGELRRFRELERFGERTVLFEGDTELAWCVRPDRETLAVFDGRLVGLDADGLFVEAREGAPWRARRVRQEISDELALDRRGSASAVVRLTNLDTDAYVEIGSGIRAERIAWPDGNMTTWNGHPRYRYPRQLHVETRPQTTSVFEDILGGLETLCRASVELGNPIRWAER